MDHQQEGLPDNASSSPYSEATTLQAIVNQLNEIQEYQRSELRRKDDELFELRQLLHSQQEQISHQQEEIRDMQQQQIESSVGHNGNGSPNGSGGSRYHNPYATIDGGSFLEELINKCYYHFGARRNSIAYQRRRGSFGRRHSQYRTMDLVHAGFLIFFTCIQLRYFVFSNRFPGDNESSNNGPSTYESYHYDYHPIPVVTKIKPWESKPATPIALQLPSGDVTDKSQWSVTEHRHKCISSIRQRHKNDLGGFLYPSTSETYKTLLVDPAYHGNVGDHMLTLGELVFTKESMNQISVRQCHYMQSEEYFPPCDDVMLQYNNNGGDGNDSDNNNNYKPWALWHAGGNWGDLWYDIMPKRIQSFEKFLKNNFNIVGMPQSLYYKDEGLKMRDVTRIKESIALGLGLATREEDNEIEDGSAFGRRLLDDNNEFMFAPDNNENNDDWGAGGSQYGDFDWNQPVVEEKPVNTSRLDTEEGIALSKSRVTFTWREKESYQHALEIYPFVSHLLIPDIAIQLGPYDPIRKSEHSSHFVDILFLSRGDHESLQTTRDRDYLQSLLSSHSQEASKMTFKVVDWPNRLEMFDKPSDPYFTETSIQLLSLGKIVICDRLHAAILCYLSGLPFVYIDQVSGKITKTFGWALETSEGCEDGTGEYSRWAKETSMEGAISKAISMIERYKLDHSNGASGGGLRGIFGF